ncbi:Vms1/Ankzf1 family peptidyl-tRNA hydrolase [Brevibacterium sp. FME17]|uniref:baeRF2 domain-containing protein n=1 Tax=Brevibacterium sp. FME17 TaxID=2742606 RepID=UPI001866FAC3|nr:Vms1/Ankzf1 family peptidyl-tRNA hydrolase [Brevibacterium sp. FME17]
MMNLENLRTVYDNQGPFATVYLEGRSPAADAEKQVRLRWDELRENLANAGAADEILRHLDGTLIVEDITEVQTDGRTVVANAAGVVLDEHWDVALGTGDAAHYGEVPELGAFVREGCRLVDMVLVIANQEGATIRELRASPQHEAKQQDESLISGDNDEDIHAPRQGALSHNQIRRRADEIVKDNARAVADHVDEIVRAREPDLVVVAGEVQGRTAVKAELSTRVTELLEETDQGGTDDDAAEEALYDALKSLASDRVQAKQTEHTENLSYSKAHDLAVEGADKVSQAAQRGAVATVLLNYDVGADGEGAILADAVLSSADVGLIDGDVADGIAAILRYDAATALAD